MYRPDEVMERLLNDLDDQSTEAIANEQQLDKNKPIMTRDDYTNFAESTMENATEEQRKYLELYIKAAKQRKLERTREQPVDMNMKRIFHLTGEAGTGKTYCYNVFIANIYIIKMVIHNR